MKENKFLALQGRKVVLPDIDAIFGTWTTQTSPHYQKLDNFINKELEFRLKPGPKLEGVKSVDLPLFVCLLWPSATYQSLTICANLMLWAFLWDDEVDAEETGNDQENIDPFKKLREDTIACLNHYRTPKPQDPDEQIFNNTIISSIDPWASAVRDQLTIQNRTLLLDECILAVRAQGDEQAFESRGRIPSIDEYLEYRVHSAGIGLELAMLQHTVGFQRGGLGEDSDFNDIIHYAKLNGALVNDVISFKKELKHPSTSNIVKILYLQHGDIIEAIDETCSRIVDSVNGVDAAAYRLLEKHPSSSDLHFNLRRFIQGVRQLLFGQYLWAIGSPRYKLCVQSLQGGLEIQL